MPSLALRRRLATKSTLPGNKGDAKLAQLKQERIARASQRVVGELGIPGEQAHCRPNGYFGGPARLPLLPLTGDVKADVEACLHPR